VGPISRNWFPAAAFAGSVVLLMLTALPGVIPGSAVTTDDEYRKEVDEWYQSRIEHLKSPEGYLTLAGLFPLADGENRFGSAEDNDLVFPHGFPAHAGVITSNDGGVRIDVAEGVTITAADEAVRSMQLKTDIDQEPTVLALGNFRFYVIERAGKPYVRLKDRQSELRQYFEGIERFPVDVAWRIEGHFKPYDPPKTLRIPNVLGYEIEQKCSGAVVFDVGGETFYLEPVPADSGRLFIVFGDETSGLETYGGGRFLVADAPSEDGVVVLDFNKAYNPPCAFTPYATCPLPHQANRLPVRIEAGEKMWGEAH
jgi:uncharacterized protein (DUF1684 family)